MYARSTTISGDPGNIDAGIAYIRDEVLPAVTQMDGCVGMSLVVDRESGRCIATSSWMSREQMEATGEMVSSLRGKGATILDGTPTVEEWEVAAMHRDHPTHEGACCRITWTRPRDLDRTIDYWRTTVVTHMEQLDGFCSASMFADRERGLACSNVSFDSRAAMEASSESAARMREEATAQTGVEFLDILECELAIAHLRVPELV
jgi:quinol monooxygenase YgiN